MRVYKAMRSSQIPSLVLRIEMGNAVASDACPTIKMFEFISQLAVDDILERPFDPKGQFFDASNRWDAALKVAGLLAIVQQSDLKSWVNSGLTVDVMIASISTVREKPYDVAPYLILMRLLNSYEYWAEQISKGEESGNHMLKLREFWVHPETGFGPIQFHEFRQSSSRFFYKEALYPYGLRSLDLFSFKPKGSEMPIIVPFREPAELVSDHVLVLAQDIPNFMPFLSSRWITEY